jgi:hypothetical protein
LLYLHAILKPMNRVFILLFLIISSLTAKAQINEVGIFVGGSNYIGDIGPTTYIAPQDLALGILYKWNRSTRHSFRFSYTYAKISSDDLDSDAANRKDRGYAFENTINEFSAGIEFNFFDFDLHQLNTQMTPYVFTGLNYFTYNNNYFLNNQLVENGNENSFSIPMVVGLKARITHSLILGAEVGVRYTFTDNLDGSNPSNDAYADLKFGNINSNDWYVFSGITLTYTFGQNPCFCPK